MLAAAYPDALSQALRFFIILPMIANRRPERRITRQTLADACHCSIKTIGRDIIALQSLGIPLHYDAADRTYTLPEKGWNPITLTLTGTEVMALSLARGVFARFPLFPLRDDITTTLDKLTLGLPPLLRERMNAAANAWNELGGLARDYTQAPVALLTNACVQRRTVEMLYDSRSGGTCQRRLVDPYRFDVRDGRYLEMDAWCHIGEKVKTFALDRVLEARLTEQTFAVRPWNPDDEGVVGGLRGGKRVEVEVRFDAEVAPFAQARNWPFQADFSKPDSAGCVVMRAQVQGVEGIVRELLTWRRHAVVIGGSELRERMIEEVRALSALYPET